MRFQALLCPLLAGVATISAAQSTAPMQKPSFGNLPLTFEANHGQTNATVRFLSRGPGYTAYLTAGGVVLSLQATLSSTLSTSGNAGASSATVQLTLVGAANNPSVVGENPQPGKVNYFLGNDPAKWQTNIPTYGKVRYKSVYPGVDLLYYGSRQQLEYDFEVQPGYDPGKIQFAIKGADQISLSQDGSLVLTLPGGEIRIQTPIVYQLSANQRIPINGSYQVLDPTHIAFHVGNYDTSKPLVIDPVLSYSSYLGGSGTNEANGIAVDSNGNVYLAGYTNAVNFPLATLGSLPENAYHVFVAELDPTGTNLIYADYIGGNAQDYAVGLVLDSQNDVYVTGSTSSSNFPAVNAYQAQQPGPYTGFLTELSSSGSSLLYSTYLGGNTYDQPNAIAIDSLGEVYVAGYTMSQNFPVTNANQAAALPNQGGAYGTYGFLTKFSAINSNGSSLVYSTYVAGNTDVAQSCGSSQCYPAPYSAMSAIAVDANDNAYVAGTTNTNNFPTTSSAYLPSNTTQLDANIGVVSQFNSAGTLDYSTYFYGSSGNPIAISAIAVDGSGSAYITGTADSDGTFPVTSTSICDPGTYGTACGYGFVTKFDPTGATLLYSTFLGPNNYASPQSLVLDANNDAYVLSSTASSNFQNNNAIESYTNKSYTGYEDLLLVEIDPSARTQLFSTYLGGSGNDSPGGMALDAAANIYATGFTDSSDFPVNPGAFQNTLALYTDAFVMKISPESTLAVTLAPYSLQFGPVFVGSGSHAGRFWPLAGGGDGGVTQPVLLRNMSSAQLTISSISITGNFTETDNCVGSIAGAGTCTISVTFDPTTPGTQTGSVSINDNAAGSPQVVSLTGFAQGPGASLAPGKLVFQSVALGSSSSAQTVTLTNSGNDSLNIAGFQVTGDYAQTNNCPSSLAANSSCTLNIVFTPTASGSRTGTLSITDNAASSPQTVALSGTGLDFSLTASVNSISVQPGTTATYTVIVSSLGGPFNNAIQLACSGAPALTACSLSSSSVAPGTNSAAVTVTVSTTGSSAKLMQPASSRESMLAAWMQLPSIGLLGFLFVGSRRTRGKKLAYVLVVMAIFGMLFFMIGCAGGTGIASQPGTAPGTYTITIAGSSGSLHHSLPLTLTVQ